MHPLLPRLFILFISLSLLGTEDPVVHLNECVNGTAIFHHGFELGAKTLKCSVEKIVQGDAVEVAEYRNNGFNVMNNREQQRIQFFNLTVMIWNLTVEDSGLYNISCYIANAPKKQRSFKITVYEPVQKPVIEIDWNCAFTDCNYTLHCHDSRNSSSARWIVLQDSKPVEILSDATIRTLLSNTSVSTEYTCVLHNLAEQKNDSIGFWQLCSVSGYSYTLCWCWINWKTGLFMTAFIGIIFLILVTRKNIKGLGVYYVLKKLRGYLPFRRIGFNSSQNEAEYRPDDVEMKVLPTK
ncbi:uncharacterized protein LOC108699376 [Xenopus laevis]|uniref:Ig-like domain-containing protein n=2 Tax=Xenopus laevis TaxID=8355 RepID=A0A974H9D8_XENLA|nr:uncharacterized protein LOC108699376 [Xenopus laevis]OCT69166.1 hypothetical protein XELAEV_18040475mg [Xenopus laevis]